MNYKKLITYGVSIVVLSSLAGVKIYMDRSKSTEKTSITTNVQNDKAANGTGKIKSTEELKTAVNSSGPVDSSQKNGKVDITLEDIVPNQEGNSSGNLINGGLFAEQGNWMYFTLTPTNQKTYPLYRAMKDGQTGLKALTDPGYIRDISVIGDWVYYINGSGPDEARIYRTKTDGSITEVICYQYITHMCVNNGYIYYVAQENNTSSIYRLKLGETMGNKGERIAADQPFYTIYISGNTIYTAIEKTRSVKGVTGTGAAAGNTAYEVYFNIYTMNLDGSKLTKLIDDSSFYFIVDNNYIYYRSSNNNAVYRAKKDGSQKTNLINYFTYAFNIYNNAIYYLGDGENVNNIYKLQLDGSSPIQLTHNTYSYNNAFNYTAIDSIMDISVIGDTLFSSGICSSGRTISRVKADGSFEKRFE